MFVWVPLDPHPTSDATPRQALDIHLDACPSPAHLRCLRTTQRSIKCSSGCLSISSPSPSPQKHPVELQVVILHLLSIPIPLMYLCNNLSVLYIYLKVQCKHNIVHFYLSCYISLQVYIFIIFQVFTILLQVIHDLLAQHPQFIHLSWSVLGHVLSKEQSKDGSDGVSDDGCLTIVQCHRYHWPPLLDLYRSSVGILPLLRYHQQTCILIIAITSQHHVLSTAAQPEPHHAPHTFHVSGQSYCACTSSQGHVSWTPQGLARI